MNTQTFCRYVSAILLGLMCCGASLQATAKTVALWKLDYSPYTGMNTRCLIDPANDFDVIIQGQQKEPPSSRPALPSGFPQAWSPLPPNPDTTADLLDSPVSTNAIYYPHGILFSSTGAVAHVQDLRKSFTVEGWHFRDTTFAPPAIGAYLPFFTLGKTWYNGGWSLGFFNLDDTNNLYFALYNYNDASGSARRRFGTPIPTAVYYKTWCHYALVYDHQGGGGLGTWEIFVNSTSYGVITNQTAPTAAGTQSPFCIGGDPGVGSQYYNLGAYDYWRVSDAALATDQFLNAGTAKTAPQTLAFYRLDAFPDGSFDLSNRVANAYHLQAPVGGTATQVTANADQAVASVPYPDLSAQFLGSRTVNQGSVTFRTASSGSLSYLLNSEGLGTHLGTNSPWTVETWIRMTALATRQIIFDVMAGNGSGGKGWMFMNYNDLSSRYCLYFGATPSYIAFPGSTGGAAETPLNTWHHLALTFDPVSGPGYQGVWECFLNSRSLGRIEYSNSYTRVNSTANFYVGGRATTYGDAVYGSMDLVRVSKGVLATNQFLNAGGYVATSTQAVTRAYWKLDSDGSAIDPASQVDPRHALVSGTNAAPAGSQQRVAGTLLKFDTTPTFIGDPAANAGSLRFTNASALVTGNLGMRLELDTPFTVEGWMRWEGGAARAVQALAGTHFDTVSGILLPPVGTANRVLYGIDAGWLLTLEARGADAAFHLACTTPAPNPFTGSATVIDADLAVLPAADLAGRWVHVAVTYDPAVNDGGRWTLLLNGVSAGTATHAQASFASHESPRFLLGGRADGTQSFDGLLDGWRVSSGIVDPDELLHFSVLRGTLLRVQ